MGRVEAISQSYQAAKEGNSMEMVAIGMVGLILFMVGGYFLSTYLKRRRLEKRKMERLKEKERRGVA